LFKGGLAFPAFHGPFAGFCGEGVIEPPARLAANMAIRILEQVELPLVGFVVD
jgi:hypothetical protein